jgi:hypothetical protein
MPLSALNWRLVQPRTVNVGYTINDLVNTIYVMGQDTTYADGTTRTPGSGSAWTWTRDQALSPGVTTAAIGVPPINALNLAYIVAGDVSARTPTMNTDAWAINALIIGMNKNSGAYNSWVNAAPMTSGQFSGFVRNTGTTALGSTTVPLTVIMIESQEGFVVILGRTDNGSSGILGGGALVDPLSGGAANGETDGRLYSVFTSGQTAFVASTWLANGAGPFNSLTSAGDAHWYTFNVGALATTRNTVKMGNFVGLTSSLTAPSGEIPNIPLSAYFSVTGQYAGQYRQIGITRNAAAGVVQEQQGTKKGISLGYSVQIVGQSVLLGY